MLFATLPGLELHREDKIIYARFLVPHLVLSTCRVAGGQRDDLGYLYNHQSCEPAGGHKHPQMRMAMTDPTAYREAIAQAHNLPPNSCATLGTAANMLNAALESAEFRGLTVSAVCTGGVEGNAGRVGDPASVVETAQGYERLLPAETPPPAGTINTMLFISEALIPGAMVLAVMTATEAKTAALQELAVGSRYSDGLATGTGTDQLAVAAPQESPTGNPPLTGAGKHSKLGELIGRVVHDAIRKTLVLQNDLTPASQRSAEAHLRRFGGNAEALQAAVAASLSPDEAALFRANFLALERDPLTVAAVAALIHLKDKTVWGVLPESCWPDAASLFAAQIAGTVSGRLEALPEFRHILTECFPDNPPATDNAAFLKLVARSLALGFQRKWPSEVAIATQKEGDAMNTT